MTELEFLEKLRDQMLPDAGDVGSIVGIIATQSYEECSKKMLIDVALCVVRKLVAAIEEVDRRQKELNNGLAQ